MDASGVFNCYQIPDRIMLIDIAEVTTPDLLENRRVILSGWQSFIVMIESIRSWYQDGTRNAGTSTNLNEYNDRQTYSLASGYSVYDIAGWLLQEVILVMLGIGMAWLTLDFRQIWMLEDYLHIIFYLNNQEIGNNTF